MSKTLFLDIDGVLNRYQTQERCRGFIGVDRELSTLLVDWLKAHPDVQVVLSSTWRLHEDMWPHLHAAGITWVGVTPRMGRRGDEIQDYIDEHGIENYAILDDDYDMLPEQYDRFSQTSFDTGLTQQNLDQLSAIFGESHD